MRGGGKADAKCIYKKQAWLEHLGNQLVGVISDAVAAPLPLAMELWRCRVAMTVNPRRLHHQHNECSLLPHAHRRQTAMVTTSHTRTNGQRSVAHPTEPGSDHCIKADHTCASELIHHFKYKAWPTGMVHDFVKSTTGRTGVRPRGPHLTPKSAQHNASPRRHWPGVSQPTWPD